MARKWWTLVAVCLGLFMLLIDITVVNVALPSIGRDLGASFSDLQWTIDAYSLSLGVLLLVAGSFGDLLGHRLIFAFGVVAFAVSSLLCGVASDPVFLIASRAAQGLGGAAMFATSLALLGRKFEGRDRGIAFGAYGATVGGAVAVGPLIGGALTSGLDWRWIFFVNLPIAAVTFALLVLKVDETQRRQVRPDVPGALLFSGAFFGLIYGVIRGNPDGWTSTNILIAFAGGAALLVAFVVLQLRRRDPMLELSLFRRPAFLGTTIAAFALSMALFSMLLYFTLYLQNILHYSAFQAGLRLLPITLLAFLMAPISGRLTESSRIPIRTLIGVGSALVGVGLALMTLVSPSSSWTVLIAGFVVAGAGAGLANPPIAASAVATVPQEKTGIGSGVNNTARQIGIATGIAAFGAIFQSRIEHVLDPRLAQAAPRLGSRRHAIVDAAGSGNATHALHSLPVSLQAPVAHAIRVSFVAGLDRILWIATAIAFVGAVLGFLLIRQRDLRDENSPGGGGGEAAKEDEGVAETGLARDADADAVPARLRFQGTASDGNGSAPVAGSDSVAAATRRQRRSAIAAPIGAVVAATLLAFGLVGMLVRALNAPHPHHLPVAVVAPAAQVNQIANKLEHALPGAFDLRHYQTAGDARDAVTDGRVVAAFLPSKKDARLWTADAQGQFTTLAVRKAFTALTHKQHLSLATSDLAPLPPSDSAGLSPFLVIPGLTLSSLAFGILLSLLGRRSPPLLRPLSLLAFVAAASATAAAVSHSWIGALPTGFWELFALFALIVGSIAGTTVALARAFGRIGLALSVVAMVIVGFAVTGAAAGYRFLPTVHRDLSQWFPPGAATTVIRYAAYFDLRQAQMQLAVLAGWCIASVLILAIAERLRQQKPVRAQVAADGRQAPTEIRRRQPAGASS
jgi:EmrB/QacA subfamily drug resistance transporter